MIKPSKNPITLLALIGIILILVFVFVLVLFDKDPTAYIGSLTTLIGVLVSSGVLGAMLNKQNEKTDAVAAKTEAVAKSVNGNTTKLLNENDALRARIREYEANTPSEGRHSLMSEETIQSIKSDSDALTGPTPVVE